MPWVRLDDQFPDHPKVVAAGADAAWLYVMALCYCNRMLTDGFVPADQVPRMAPVKFAKRLVEVGLWTSAPGGYTVHDYHDFQPTREEVLAERAQNAERQERFRQRRAEARRNARNNAVTNVVTGGISNDVSNGLVTVPPFPIPIPSTDQNSLRSEAHAPSGSRARSDSGGGGLSSGQLRHAALELVAAWNAHAVEPFVLVAETLSDDAQRRAIRALQTHPDVDWWRALVAEVMSSTFLAGGGERGWVADFFWVIEHADDIATGRYRDRPGGDARGSKTAGNHAALARFAERRTE